VVDLSKADFFRADLTRASLRGAIAKGAEFYQARLVNTVLKDADLTGANFYQADLSGAEFSGSELRLVGANFAHARNVPSDIAKRLNESGVYGGTSAGKRPPESPRAVFFSRPGSADIEVRHHLRALVDRVNQQEISVVEIDRESYSPTGAVAEVPGRLEHARPERGSSQHRVLASVTTIRALNSRRNAECSDSSDTRRYAHGHVLEIVRRSGRTPAAHY
jgi:hypothetical protein